MFANKILTAATVTLAFVAALTSCGNTDSVQTAADTAPGTTAAETTAAHTLEENTYFPDSTNVKLLGRTHAENNALWLAQSASGVEFTFHGTSAAVDIISDSSAFGASDSQARFAVYVNGERKLDEMIKDYEKSYDIFSSDEAEDVTVRIVKLSESANSSFGIKDLTVTSDNGISPTPEKDLKIEFIGDSITCAYGVDDEVKEHHFSTETEDATKSYAYKTAEKLDADYSLVCYSGHGIVSGYTSEKKNTSQLVPTVYEQFAKSYGSANSYYNVSSEWDFSSFVPDFVVINLGTNDNSYTKNKQERKDEFTEGYTEFLKMIRKDNPDAYIVCTLGLMGGELYQSIEDAVSAYTDETGDSNVSAFRLSQQDMNANGIAADWHPSEKSHEVAANELSEYIRSLMNDNAADAA